MKKEVLAILGPVEDLGDGVFDMAGMSPEILRDVLRHGREFAGIPWDVLKEVTNYTTESVDYAFETILPR